MAADWAQFESTYQKKAEIVYINVDQRTSPEFTKYARFAPQSIPYTLWLDRQDKPLADQTGPMTAAEMGAVSDKFLK
ncbi:hypothetical protein ABS71_09290 [bacterium SCN 62-11]|nr:hypothetical protein [Candidatus Eremiobacteraeota bacterium]ODT68977.1 MAG: hypothetical protein ABS71_09290 [bacterium SCN 62-11]